MSISYPDQDVDVLARTLWGEARGEDRIGREMVANVVMNRVAIAQKHLERTGAPYWWGSTPAEVCLKPWQFSCWNENDPNRPQVEAATEADPVFAECLEIARAAVAGELPDRTNGATHYANMPLLVKLGAAPNWATWSRLVAHHGRHSFFRVG